MRIRRFLCACLIDVCLIGVLAGCSLSDIPNTLEPEKPRAINQADIGTVALQLSQELVDAGITTLAVVDFTDSDGNVTAFEQNITEQVFLAMSGFTGKFWAISGQYLQEMMSVQSSERPVWEVMGIDAIVYGTVVPASSDEVILRFHVVDANTTATLRQLTGVCRAVPNTELAEAYLIPPGARSRGVTVAHELQSDIPAFPWPPPQASASGRVPSEFLIYNDGETTLSDVAYRLQYALDLTEYSERSFYAVPDGFALVTRLEQINPDGTSKSPPERWAVDVTPPRIFSLGEYLKALFTAQEGHFRIIAFIVTSSPFIQSSQSDINREEAMKWLSTGVQVLPSAMGQMPYTQRHYCVALIYEFEQPTRNHSPYFKQLSMLPGVEHLKKAQLWQILEQ